MTVRSGFACQAGWRRLVIFHKILVSRQDFAKRPFPFCRGRGIMTPT